MSAVLVAQSVSKAYQRFRNRPVTMKESAVRWLNRRGDAGSQHWALRDVSFSVARGSSLGIVGHNGAGKSTLLRLLCGLSRPSSGRIFHSGHVSGLLDLGSGFHPDLTGRENIHTGALLSGLTAREARECEAEIIEFAELEEFIDQPIRTYSSGMYLRLAFSTAMQFNPAVLVIDEILAVGDIRFQQKCLNRLEHFRTMGKTLILTSHSVDQIRSLCDEVLVLDEGRVVMQGETDIALDCYVDLMRQRTERRAAQLGGESRPAPLVRTGSRQGTHEATIAEVNLYDLNGRRIEQLVTGSGVIIETKYELHAPLPDMAFLVGVYNESGVKCYETSIDSVVAKFGKLGEHGRLVCRLPALPLQPGRYYVNLGFYPADWGYVYDYHWNIHDFMIIGIDERRMDSSGMLMLQADWGAKAE